MARISTDLCALISMYPTFSSENENPQYHVKIDSFSSESFRAGNSVMGGE